MQINPKLIRKLEPLTLPKRYKGAKGGRGSGKSHFFAEMAVVNMASRQNWSIACIREIQKSLKYSAKGLIESKIDALGVSHLFEITQSEIRSALGGVAIFQGMQDHTADSIKSLEGFNAAWVEEANGLSARSWRLLRPTIRSEGSEIWASWNPDQPEDAVEEFFAQDADDRICIHININENNFAPQTLIDEYEADKKAAADNPAKFAIFDHTWNGAYNSRSDAIVFAGCFSVDDFITDGMDGPYYGADFGFANDPTVLVECWISNGNLYVRRESGRVGLEIDDTGNLWSKEVPGSESHVIRADSARPETISYLKRNGFPRIVGVEKGKGSVEDGISHIRNYGKVVIHPDCPETAREFRTYSYDKNKAGDILPKVVDAFNHRIDAIRYALRPLWGGKSKSGPPNLQAMGR